MLSGQIDGIGVKAHIKAKDDKGKKLDDVDIPLQGDAESQHHEALGSSSPGCTTMKRAGRSWPWATGWSMAASAIRAP